MLFFIYLINSPSQIPLLGPHIVFCVLRNHYLNGHSRFHVYTQDDKFLDVTELYVSNHIISIFLLDNK